MTYGQRVNLVQRVFNYWPKRICGTICSNRLRVNVDKMSVGTNIFRRKVSAPTLRFRTNFPQKLFFSFFSILSLKERKLGSDHHLKHFWCRKGPNNRWPRSPQTPPFFNTEKIPPVSLFWVEILAFLDFERKKKL